VLPVEERRLRDGGGARERERAYDHDCGGAERETTRPLRQPGQERECHGEDDDAASDLVATREQRRGPAGSDQERDHRRQGTP
jgi:hypothetical protein